MTIMPAISTLTKVSGFFGLSQISKVSSQKPNNSIFEIARWRVIYSVILTFLLFLMIPIQIIRTYNGFDSEIKLANYLGFVYWNILSPFGVVLAVGCSILHRRTLVRTANMICSCQKTLIGLAADGCPKSAPVWKFSAVFLSFWLMVVTAYIYGSPPSGFDETIIELVVMIYISVMLVHFATYVLVVRSLLCQLNNGLATSFEALVEPEEAWQVPVKLFTVLPKQENTAEKMLLTKNKERHGDQVSVKHILQVAKQQ